MARKESSRAIAVLLLAAKLIWAQQIDQGKRAFMAHCAQCHGPQGEGGRGPRLAQARLSRAPDDDSLIELIRRGVAGSEMPPTPSTIVPDAELRNLIAYVRSLAGKPEEPIGGDVTRGKRVFFGNGNCSACHTIAGQGNVVGPDLADIGSKRSASWLREKLINPAASVSDAYLQVQLATKDSRRITGLRLNEDSFSIQVRDMSGQIHSFWKRELTMLVKDEGKTPMPSSRGVLNAEDLRDLLAYLVSLRSSK